MAQRWHLSTASDLFFKKYFSLIKNCRELHLKINRKLYLDVTFWLPYKWIQNRVRRFRDSFSGISDIQKQSSRGVSRKRCSENMQQLYRRTPMPKCDLNKVVLQLYWNHTSAWVFTYKFAAYFQNTYTSEGNFWREPLFFPFPFDTLIS